MPVLPSNPSRSRKAATRMSSVPENFITGEVTLTPGNQFCRSSLSSTEETNTTPSSPCGPCGDQQILTNGCNDVYKIRILRRNIVTIESMTVPGRFIGIGGETKNSTTSALNFKAALVDGSTGDSHKLRVVPPINGRNDYFSFMPLHKPGYVLNIRYSNGPMYFSSLRLNKGIKNFRRNASWKMHKVVEEETLEADDGAPASCLDCTDRTATETDHSSEHTEEESLCCTMYEEFSSSELEDASVVATDLKQQAPPPQMPRKPVAAPIPRTISC